VTGRDAALAVVVWAAFNVVLAALMFVFTDDLMSHAVYWLGIALLVPVAGLALLARDRARRRVPEGSGGAVVLALALAFAALGAALGGWAAWIGAALAVVGIALLWSEERSA
jgi:hypothetical protein